MILWAENQCSRNHFNTWSASTSCTDRLRYTAYDTQGNIKQSIIDLSDYCRRVFFKAQVRHSVKDVGCFAERYKATCRKYNQKFIIQTNSQWDAKPCSQGNVFRQRASTHHDDKDKVRSFCDIALKFTKQIRASNQLLKTWPTSGSCSCSLSSFPYITHLLASATLRWKMSTRSLVECCLAVVIQDRRIDFAFVINAWCIAAIARFHCRLSFALTCLANWIMWRICSSGFIFEAVSTESAI